MSLKQFIGSGDDRMVRQYDYDDESVIVVDLDVPDETVSLEVLEDAVLVVVETVEESGQAEIPIPEDGDARAFMNNGVLTIEVSR